MLEITLPDSPSLVFDVLHSANTNVLRASWAALGLSLNRPGLPKYKYDPLEYGGKVYDLLLKEGMRPEYVNENAAAAFTRFADSVVSEEEVEDAKKN